MFFKIIFLKKFVNFTGNTCVGVFFNKVAGPQNSNFIKNKLQQRFFSAKFAKFAKSPAGAFAGLKFPVCNLFKKENPAKMLFL